MAWSTATAPVRRSSPCPAACLPSSSLSTAPERRLLATAVLHQVGHGCRWHHVLYQVCFGSCFQVFHLYVTYVAMIMCVCCKYMFSSVSYVCLTCFICMFHVFSSVYFICFILMLQKDLMLHMLQ
jgi:hypothetical protein